MSMISRLLAFSLVLATSACVTRQAAEQTPAIETKATLEDLDSCADRGPSSESSLQCRAIFSRPGLIAPPSESADVSLGQLRLQSLRAHPIDLEIAMSLIAPAPEKAPREDIAEFLAIANPKITKEQALARLNKPRSLLGKIKGAVLTSKNVNEWSSTDLLARLKDRDAATQRFLVEAYLRFNKNGLNSSDSTTLLSTLLRGTKSDIVSEYVVRDYNEAPTHAAARLRLMREVAQLTIRASGAKTQEQSVLDPILVFAESHAQVRGIALVDLYRVEPKSAATRDFERLLLDQKKLFRSDILEAMAKANLDIYEPALWREKIREALNAPGPTAEAAKVTLTAFDLHWVKKVNGGWSFKEALEVLRDSAPLRQKLIGKDPIVFSPHLLLMTKASTDAGRRLVLDELFQLGPSAVAAYVGKDKRSNERVHYLLQAAKDTPLSALADQSLRDFLGDFSQRRLTSLNDPQSRQLKKLIAERYPDLRPQISANLASLLHAAELTDPASLFESVRKDQDGAETMLERALESVIKNNAPPEVFKASKNPWHAYLKSLPPDVRADHLWRLLEKNSRTTQALSSFISNLEPIDGVRDTVIRFLVGSRFMSSNRSDFTQEQVLTMFGGDRFARFFPHLEGARLSDAIRTKLIIALRTDPSLAAGEGLNPTWLREKLDDDEIRTSIPQVFGFRPALQYSRLIVQADDGFGGATVARPPRQIRGLIVQGHYERTGHSIMFQLNRERGQDQLEEKAPELRLAIERQLRSGALAKEPVLIQRLFAVNWSLNSDASLIDSIRDRALKIAQGYGSFYDLRVEIHNFPTFSTLERVRAFRKRMNSSSRWTGEMDTLIGELERFLGDSNGGGNLDRVIKEYLPVSDQSRAILADLATGFDSLAPEAQLEKLIQLRDRYADIKAASRSQNKKTEALLGDQAFSEVATVIFSRWLEAMGERSLPERINAVRLGLEHLRRDGLFTQEQIDGFMSSLTSISQARGTSDLEKRTLANAVLRGILDQVYFKINDDFGFFDQTMLRTVGRGNAPAIKFVDNFMRSGMTFMLSKVVDGQAREIAVAKNITHSVRGQDLHGLVEVYNPGETVGILRLNKEPMSLAKEDIAVFDQMPGESAAVSGFITVGVGARLSHLQLLSKSLKIPNVQVAKELLPNLQELDGKWVRVRADEDGRLVIEEASRENRIIAQRNRVAVPRANNRAKEPIAFSDLQEQSGAQFAGPKGVTLAKLFGDQRTQTQTPDGVVLPFGLFQEYVARTGLQPLLDLLAQVRLENRLLIGILTAQIALKIESNPIPREILSQIKSSIDALEKRTGNQLGYFVRSDTNVEDLPDFNGAGLNESVPNVPNDLKALDQAVRRVWVSPYTEKSIYWRGEALGRATVTLARPSVVIMPTVEAKASGVLITKGGPDWKPGHGRLSANFGIGSVVEAGRPVEEFTFETGQAVRLSLSVSRTMPVAGPKGGLVQKEIASGTAVLTIDQANQLNALGRQIENTLGDQPHGWDIEWAIDSAGRLIILQARPNM